MQVDEQHVIEIHMHSPDNGNGDGAHSNTDTANAVAVIEEIKTRRNAQPSQPSQPSAPPRALRAVAPTQLTSASSSLSSLSASSISQRPVAVTPAEHLSNVTDCTQQLCSVCLAVVVFVVFVAAMLIGGSVVLAHAATAVSVCSGSIWYFVLLGTLEYGYVLLLMMLRCWRWGSGRSEVEEGAHGSSQVRSGGGGGSSRLETVLSVIHWGITLTVIAWGATIVHSTGLACKLAYPTLWQLAEALLVFAVIKTCLRGGWLVVALWVAWSLRQRPPETDAPAIVAAPSTNANSMTQTGAADSKAITIPIPLPSPTLGKAGNATAAAFTPECIICISQIKDCALFPCAHMCTCSTCAKKLSRCPICRKPIVTRLKVYLQ